MRLVNVLTTLFVTTTVAFRMKPIIQRGGGGRKPSPPDRSDPQQLPSTAQQPTSACKLIICQITDVYSLEHLASFKTLVEEIRQKNPGATVISMLTGDFLSPYLLSSVDRGAGMMNALNKIPLDYLTWGNHEADIDHKTVCKHVRNFQGTFLNSNMVDHEAMESQQEYDVIELCSPDQTQRRKVGLCAVLSDDPDLYSHFPAPGAFGGATITDPWKALTKYQHILEKEEGCDLVIPLQHLYVPDDHITCQNFDFPLILSGHDHHKVDEVVENTRLIKAGMNAVHAAVVEVSWDCAKANTPTIKARFEKCSDYKPDPLLEEENERAYDALIPLRKTELASIPKKFFPLSSGNARGEVCTMGLFICRLIKSAMNNARPNQQVDAVLLMGGNIRGNVAEYPEGSFFSFEMLQQEIKADETLAVVPMPGWLLAEGVRATHSGEPIPGWMQYDEGIQQDVDGHVTHVGGQPISPNHIYRVATKVSDLTNGQCPPWTKYYTHFPQVLPPKGSYINIQSEIMSHVAQTLWARLWDDMECPIDACPMERLDILDTTGDGEVTVPEIQHALKVHLGLSIDERETTLAEMVHSVADTTGDGKVTLDDFQQHCEQKSQSLVDQWISSYEKAEKAFDKVRTELFSLEESKKDNSPVP